MDNTGEGYRGSDGELDILSIPSIITESILTILSCNESGSSVYHEYAKDTEYTMYPEYAEYVNLSDLPHSIR